MCYDKEWIFQIDDFKCREMLTELWARSGNFVSIMYVSSRGNTKCLGIAKFTVEHDAEHVKILFIELSDRNEDIIFRLTYHSTWTRV